MSYVCLCVNVPASEWVSECKCFCVRACVWWNVQWVATISKNIKRERQEKKTHKFKNSKSIMKKKNNNDDNNNNHHVKRNNEKTKEFERFCCAVLLLLPLPRCCCFFSLCWSNVCVRACDIIILFSIHKTMCGHTQAHRHTHNNKKQQQWIGKKIFCFVYISWAESIQYRRMYHVLPDRFVHRYFSFWMMINIVHLWACVCVCVCVCKCMLFAPRTPDHVWVSALAVCWLQMWVF